MFDTSFKKLKYKTFDHACSKSSNGSAIDLGLTNNSYLYQKTQSFETGRINPHHLI